MKNLKQKMKRAASGIGKTPTFHKNDGGTGKLDKRKQPKKPKQNEFTPDELLNREFFKEQLKMNKKSIPRSMKGVKTRRPKGAPKI